MLGIMFAKYKTSIYASYNQKTEAFHLCFIRAVDHKWTFSLNYNCILM